MRAGKHNAKMSKEAARKAQAELDQNPPVPDDPDFVFLTRGKQDRWLRLYRRSLW
jgi:hypothetical protein